MAEGAGYNGDNAVRRRGSGSGNQDTNDTQRRNRMSAPGRPRNWSLPIRDDDTAYDISSYQQQQQPPLPTHTDNHYYPSPQDRRRSVVTSKKRKSDEMLDSSAQHVGVAHTRDPSSISYPTPQSPVSPLTPPRPRIAAGPGYDEHGRGASLRTGMFTRNVAQRQNVHHGSEGSSSVSSDPMLKHKAANVTVTPVLERGFSHSSPPYAGARPSARRRRAKQGPSPTSKWFTGQFHRFLPFAKIGAGLEKARKVILRIHDVPTSKDGRRIPLDPTRTGPLTDERTRRAYIGNTIRSSKYNAWNFVPRQLFAQFSKLANFYFLVVSILQMIPGLSTTGNYTTIVPLLFFISVSIGKEGYEDLRRHRLDKEENNKKASVLRTHHSISGDKSIDRSALRHANDSPEWTQLKWHRLQVGDVVKLNRDDAAPADLILLHSDGPNGIAYVETMALDGETNLKPKQSPGSARTQCRDPSALARCRAEFVVEDPNLDLYNFEGRVSMEGKTSPLTNNEIIYRGSILRNTSEAYGLVIYTGEECKIRMNANKNPRVKAPSLQYIVNKIVLFIVIFVVALSAFCTIGYQFWRSSTEAKAWYITKNGDVPLGQIVAGFIIMYNTMIPLSLYVSMEIIKICQMLLLNDVDMYDPVTNTPFEAHTSTINEELGQVSYIFSDKTGTLTENIMRFRKLSVAGYAWLHNVDLKKVELDSAQTKDTTSLFRQHSYSPTSSVSHLKSTGFSASQNEYEMQAFHREEATHWQSSARPAKPQQELTTSDMIRYVQQHPNTIFSRKAKMFLLCLAVCHTCLPERTGQEDELSYQASSPDELALVQAAVELGFMAWDREVSLLTLKLYPHGPDRDAIFETYEILDIIEFSSKRKRMSVVVRFPNGQICVMCKGADSVIMERLRLSQLAKQKAGEVERRASERRSSEAHEALRRRSSQLERRASVMSTAGSIHMSQQGMGRLAPIRDEVGGWLQEREHDADVEYDAASPAYNMHPAGGNPFTGHPGDLAADEIIDETAAGDESSIMEKCFQHVNDFASEGLRTLLFGHRFLQHDEYLSWKKIYHDATTSLVNRQLLIENAGELIEQQLDLTGATAIEDKLQKGVPETIERLRRANIKLWMLTGDKRETAINIGHSCRLIKDYSAVTILDIENADLVDKIMEATYNIDQGVVAHSVIVIDGGTLAAIDADSTLKDLFMDLAIITDSVICCRASPSQKAGLVESIRREVTGSVTLAIGDGANDIAMIQEAHVGIGITGKEGLQAARTSDYAIAQFRFLAKLVLVHGRWNYIRTCKYTVGTFWKEMLFYLIQALYQLWNGYTGTSLYEPWSLTMFNTLFTSLPVIFIGVFEKDLKASTLIAVPELYTRGQLCLGFNFKVYLSWMFLASTEAMLIYFITYELYAGFTFSKDQSLFAIGDLCYTAAVFVIAIKLQVLEIHDHSMMAAISMVLSLGGWFLWNIALAAIYKNNQIYGVQDGFLHRFGQNVAWWLVVAISVSACIVLEYGIRAVKSAFKPTDVESFQSLEKDPIMRRRFESASKLWLEPGWSDATDKESRRALRETGAAAPAVAMHGDGKRRSIQREVQDVLIADGLRESTDIHDMLKRHSANVRR